MYPTEEAPIYGVFVGNFVKAFEKLGVRFSRMAVITNPTASLLKKVGKYIRFYLSICKGVFARDYDIIYAHFIFHSAIGLYFLLPFINKPIIMNAHGSDVLNDSKIYKVLLKWFVKPVLRKAKYVVVPSTYFRELMVDEIGIEESKVVIYPSGGVNTEMFKPEGHAPIHEQTIFGYISRITSGKGYNIFLKAINYLKNEYPNLRFNAVIVGSGTEEPEMKKYISLNKLESIVKIFPSANQEKLLGYFYMMDCFVFPTIRKQESLGLIGLEAMACGRPVIGSDIGGLKDYIKDEINGYKFEPGNYKELGERMKCFIVMNNDKRAELVQNALDTAKEFDKEIVSMKLINILSDILK